MLPRIYAIIRLQRDFEYVLDISLLERSSDV